MVNESTRLFISNSREQCLAGCSDVKLNVASQKKKKKKKKRMLDIFGDLLKLEHEFLTTFLTTN